MERRAEESPAPRRSARAPVASRIPVLCASTATDSTRARLRAGNAPGASTLGSYLAALEVGRYNSRRDFVMMRAQPKLR